MTSRNQSRPGLANKIVPAGLALAAGLAILGSVAPAQAAVGWQTRFTYDVPASTTSVFLHLGCPANAAVADSGAYTFNNIGQVSNVDVTFNGPRLDESQPYYGEWGWVFNWPTGAPSGTVVEINVHCVKK